MNQQSAVSVGVIGCGISGLKTAKCLIDDGFSDVVILEKSDSVGGIWAKDNYYPTLTSNNNIDVLQWSDLPNTSNASNGSVGAKELTAYLQAYADKYDLGKRCHFHTTVKNIRRGDTNEKNWVVETVREGKEVKYELDKIVIASGQHHKKVIPSWAQAAMKERANVVHSNDFRPELEDARWTNSEHVVVIGGSKSGLDAAIRAAQAGKKVDFLVSHPPWMPPATLPFGLSLSWALVTSFLDALIPFYPDPISGLFNGWVAKFFHKSARGQKIVRGFSDATAGDWIKGHDYKGSENAQRFLPDTDFFFAGGISYPASPHLFEFLNNGGINVIRGRATGLSATSPSELLIKYITQAGNEQTLSAQSVVLATGYKPGYTYFDQKLAYELGLPVPLSSADPEKERLWDKACTKELANLLEARPMLASPPAVILTKKDTKSDFDASVGDEVNTPLRLYRRMAPLEYAVSGDNSIAFVHLVILYVTFPHVEACAQWTSDYFQGNLRLPAAVGTEARRAKMAEEINMGVAYSRQMYGKYGWLGQGFGRDYIKLLRVLWWDMGFTMPWRFGYWPSIGGELAKLRAKRA